MALRKRLPQALLGPNELVKEGGGGVRDKAVRIATRPSKREGSGPPGQWGALKLQAIRHYLDTATPTRSFVGNKCARTPYMSSQYSNFAPFKYELHPRGRKCAIKIT